MVLVLAVISAIPQSRQMVLGWTKGSASTASGPSKNAKFVAILPFRTIGDDASLGDVASGIAEALSAKLFQLKDVHLSSPAAAAKVNPKDPMAQIARSLGAKLLVQGSVQSSGDKLAIVVSMDDPATGRRVWSQEFSGLKQDLLTLQDQIYSGLVNALELKLTNEEMAKSTAHLTEDISAYSLYLKGRGVLRGQRDEKNLKQALDLFEQATRKDPNFTLAYTGIADTCRYLYALKKEGSWATRGLGAANRAQALNDGLPEVHFALGSLFTATGKNAEAVAELKRALELAPNSDDGYLRLGRAYLDQGNSAEAVNAFRRAVDANPYYWSNYNMLGVGYLNSGDNAQALKAFQQVTELEPNNANGWSNIGLIAGREGNWMEAIQAYLKASELQPSAESYSNLGTSYFFLGKYDDARANFEKASNLRPQQAEFVGFLGDCYRRLGDGVKARASYERAISLAYQALQTNPRDSSALGELGIYYAKQGDATKGLDFIRRARAIDPEDGDFLYDEALINTLANRMPEALRSLEGALSKGYSLKAVMSDPELAPLRQQPEFQAMTQKFETSKTGK